MNRSLETRISEKVPDPTWDEFVEITPGGHHVQTSLWAATKASLGWKSFRLTITENNRILGGAQVLYHPYPLVGSVAYVTKGPLVKPEAASLAQEIIDKLYQVSRRRHIQLLAIQPPNNGEFIIGMLAKEGFRPSTLELAPVASIIIDTCQDEKAILAQMKRQTRQNVLRSIREGMTVREGTKADLPIFYDLHVQSSQRQNFLPYAYEYFETMWDWLAPEHYLALLISEYQGEPVSTFLLATFQDTVVAKILGWSGLYREHRPNDALTWGAILWAKEHGYHFFDFEGVDQEAAQYLLKGEALPEHMRTSPNFFKYGFGGTTVFYPQAYDYVFNPVLRWGYNRFPVQVATQSTTSKVLDYFRKRNFESVVQKHH